MPVAQGRVPGAALVKTTARSRTTRLCETCSAANAHTSRWRGHQGPHDIRPFDTRATREAEQAVLAATPPPAVAMATVAVHAIPAESQAGAKPVAVAVAAVAATCTKCTAGSGKAAGHKGRHVQKLAPEGKRKSSRKPKPVTEQLTITFGNQQVTGTLVVRQEDRRRVAKQVEYQRRCAKTQAKAQAAEFAKPPAGGTRASGGQPGPGL